MPIIFFIQPGRLRSPVVLIKIHKCHPPRTCAFWSQTSFPCLWNQRWLPQKKAASSTERSRREWINLSFPKNKPFVVYRTTISVSVYWFFCVSVCWLFCVLCFNRTGLNTSIEMDRSVFGEVECLSLSGVFHALLPLTLQKYLSENPLLSQNRCDGVALRIRQPLVVDAYLTDVANERLSG